MLSMQAAVCDRTALIILDPAVLVGTESVHLVTPLAASVPPPLPVSWQPAQQPQALSPTLCTVNIATSLLIMGQDNPMPDTCHAAK